MSSEDEPSEEDLRRAIRRVVGHETSRLALESELEHLGAENKRLQAEVQRLENLLNRPIYVTPSPAPTATYSAPTAFETNVSAQLGTMSSALLRIAASLEGQ